MPRQRARRRRNFLLLFSLPAPPPLFFVATAVLAASFSFSAAAAHLLDLPPLPQSTAHREQPAEVCFVVRTYRKHGEGGGKGEAREKSLPPLARLLRSLKAQTNPNWRALLLVADEDPFLELEGVVERVLGTKDERAWVWARSSGVEHRARESSSISSSSIPSMSSSSQPQPRRRWLPGFHRALFALTDDAVHLGCPASAELVVVTNGDNAYAPRFVERALREARGGGWGVEKEEEERSRRRGVEGGVEGRKKKSSRPPSPPRPLLKADLVLFDYASRYARPTSVPCERFAAVEVAEAGEGGGEGRGGGGSSSSSSNASSSPSLHLLPYCKRNLGRWCQTDLGAVAFRLSRLRGEEGEDEAAHSAQGLRRCRQGRGRRFTDEVSLALAARKGLSADSLDGVFVESLVQGGGWVVARVRSGARGSRDDPWRVGGGTGGGEEKEEDEDGSRKPSLRVPFPSPSRSHECFFDHSPSPHACALSRGVWDDSEAATAEGAGGECLGEAEAEERLLRLSGKSPVSSKSPSLELVEVKVLPGENAPPLRCLRWRDSEGQHAAMRAFYGGRCEEAAEG